MCLCIRFCVGPAIVVVWRNREESLSLSLSLVRSLHCTKQRRGPRCAVAQSVRRRCCCFCCCYRCGLQATRRCQESAPPASERARPDCSSPPFEQVKELAAASQCASQCFCLSVCVCMFVKIRRALSLVCVCVCLRPASRSSVQLGNNQPMANNSRESDCID